MKQYIYSAAECGFKEWPQGTLRLTGFDIVMDPKEADVFVVPGALTQLFPNADAVQRLPFFKGNEDKHVLFDCSDNEPLYGLPCLFIRCNTRTWYLPKDPNTISWPWPVEDFTECVDVPEVGFKYDVSFQGWYSTDTRKQAAESCQQNHALRCDIQGYSDFCGYIYDTPEGVRRRKEFRRSMKESRVALCGESIHGVFPYRFFEAMSAGRVPFLISSDYVLPFADEIPYGRFVLQARRDQAPAAGSMIREFIKCGDDELIEKGRLARYWWLKLLNRDDWATLMAYAVTKQLQKRGVTSGCG